MNKKGFTLIELLAVILILAIIAAIISPIVGNIIENAREQSAKRSAERYVAAAQEYYVESQMDLNKADNLGTNIIDKLELQNEDGTGYITAYSDGTTEMAIVINNICFTKTTTQDPKDIEVSKDVANCTVNSSRVRIASINSMETYIEVIVDNSSSPDVTLSTCKYGTSRNDMSLDGSVSGNTCTLSPTTSGTRYFFVLNLSDDSKLSGSAQGGTGTSTYTGGGDHGGGAGGNGGSGSGGNGGSGSGGNQFGGVAGPVTTDDEGQTIYQGRYLGNVKKVYFDVTNGTKCTIAQWSANNGNTINNMSSGCLKFYAYMEDDVAYTMILDRNIIGPRQWYGSNNNGLGPVNVLSQLKQITDSWQGTVTPSNYTRVYAINGSYAAYDINYNTDGYKARLITADEIAHITANDSFDSVTATTDKWFYLDGYAVKDTDPTWHTQIATATKESAFSWLMNYLINNANFGGTANGNGSGSGYWTSDAIAGTTTSAWLVSNSGKLTNGVFQTGNSDRALAVNDLSNCGIRPVITLLKSIVD